MASYCLLLCMGRAWFALINYYECHYKVLSDHAQVSNWLVTSAGVSNLVINLIKAQNIKGNYSKIF